MLKVTFKTIIGSAFLTLLGCSGKSNSSVQALEGGVIRIVEVPSSVAKVEGYDLQVFVRSAYDVNLNTNKLSDRLELIGKLRPDCVRPALVSETVVEGETLVGVTMNKYYMNVSCDKAL